MTYNAFETGVESGNPVELYEFKIGVEIFRFTSAQLDYTISAIVYEASPISRSNFAASAGDSDDDRVEIRAPYDNLFAVKYLTSAPGQKATITIKRVHRADPDQETITAFKGTVRNVSFSNDGKEAIIQCLPLTSAYSRTVPRFHYSGLCNHMLYDARCKIDKDSSSFRLIATCTAVSGKTITVAGAGAFNALTDFFVGGYVEFQNDFRMVTAQSVNVLTLSLPFGISPLNQSVIARAGCKLRLVEDCQDKFANTVNFGGFNYVPKKNPFETGLD